MKSALSNQMKILMTAGVILIGLSLFIFLGVMPLLTRVDFLYSEIRHNYQQIADFSAKISAVKQATIKLGQIGNDAVAIAEIFPLREDSVVLVESLESAFVRAGLVANLTIIDSKEAIIPPKPLPPVVKNVNGLEEVPYILDLYGDYRKMVNFFLYMENLGIFTEVSNFTLNAETKSSDNGKVVIKTGFGSGELRGVLFIRKP